MKIILYSTGIQCSYIKRGVTWSYFLESVINLAAQLKTCWTQSIKYLGNPYIRELQLSKREIMKALNNEYITKAFYYNFKEIYTDIPLEDDQVLFLQGFNDDL